MSHWNTRGLRGSAFEETINMTNERYRKEGLALIQKIIPMNISKDQVRDTYEQFCQQHSKAGDLFRREIRQMAGKILDHPDAPEWAAQDPSELIILTAMTGTFARLLTEKLLLMEGLDESHAGDLSLDVSRPHRSSTGKD